jgi:uncharacterized protein (DUF433 family)
MSTATTYAYITSTPGICGGKPCIDGHRVRVLDIAVDFDKLGMTCEEISQQYPGLTLSQIHSALAYYFDHRDEILAELDEEKRMVEEFKRKYPEAVR